MAYLDIFRKRSSSLNASENANTYFEEESLRELNAQLASSVNSLVATIDSVDYQIILSSKSNSTNKDLKNISAPYSVPISIGTVLETLGEHWVVIQKNLNIIDAFFSGIVVKANYFLEWVDWYGVVHSNYSFITGNMYSFLSDAYVSSPFHIEETTKSIMALMPSNILVNHDKLMFNGKAWKITSIDGESLNGLFFVSLKNVPINKELDNTSLNLANYYAVNDWTIEIQNNDILELLVAEVATIVPVVKLNGIVQEEDCEITNTSSYTVISGLVVTGASLGTETLTVALSGNLTITQDISVEIVASKSINRTVYIEATQSVSPLTSYPLIGYEIVDGVTTVTAGTFATLTDINDIISSITVEDASTVYVLIAESAVPGQTASIQFTSSGETDTIIMTVKSFWT